MYDESEGYARVRAVFRRGLRLLNIRNPKRCPWEMKLLPTRYVRYDVPGC